MKKKKGLTLIEVVIAMAFISFVYIFIVQVFFGGYKNITISDVIDAATILAENKMTAITTMKNPLYIGLDSYTISLLEKGETTPFRLYKEGRIKLNQRETIIVETGKTSEGLRIFGKVVNFTRKVEWSIEEIQPLLIHIWVTVSWVDPTGVIKKDSYQIETCLSG